MALLSLRSKDLKMNCWYQQFDTIFFMCQNIMEQHTVWIQDKLYILIFTDEEQS